MEKQTKSLGIKLICPDCGHDKFHIYTRGKQGLELECILCGAVYLDKTD